MRIRFIISPILLLSIVLSKTPAIAQGSAEFNNVELIVCTYAEAIKADASMFGAYNNIIKELIDHPSNSFTIPLPGRTQECLQETGLLEASDISVYAIPLPDNEGISIHTHVVNNMIDRVEQKFGSTTMLEFNRLALYWNNPFDSDGYIPNLDERLMEIINQDPTIPGAHAILGIINANRSAFPQAIMNFSTAVELRPADPRFKFNLAQAYLLNGELGRAKTTLSEVLSTNNSFWDSKLSLAALAIYSGYLVEAAQQLNNIPQDATGIMQLTSVADYLRAYISFKNNDFEGSLALLDSGLKKRVDIFGIGDGYWVNMTAATLETYLGRSGKWNNLWKSIENRRYPDVSIDGNDPQAQAWLNLSIACSIQSPPSKWVTPNNCLPSDLHSRIETLFAYLINPVFKRLYFRNIAFTAGKACPFLYSWNPETNQWVFDTTIITGLHGKSLETEQKQQLIFFSGKVRIRETEEEISYIDRLVIEAVDSSGRIQIFYPDEKSPELLAVDGDKLILHQGEEVVISFDGFDPDKEYKSYQVIATGYYDPLLLSRAD